MTRTTQDESANPAEPHEQRLRDRMRAKLLPFTPRPKAPFPPDDPRPPESPRAA